MAKAALNMLTRTSAGELATKRIFMNSVDTGYPHDFFFFVVIFLSFMMAFFVFV
jgi:NAD(P)-dependent dehydrogenase (short-subunit alcohol dehydrogenase family)